jgi:HEAT repeat protein
VRSRALAILSELPKLRQARADQLAAMGKDPDPQVRAKAIETLGTLDAKQISPAIVEACRAALGDDDSAVRLAATESVRALKITDGEVLDALGHNLADDRDLLRVTLEALADFGDKASSMIPAVSRLAAHEKAEVRAAALNTLAAIDKDTPQLVGWLTAALDDSQWEVRRIAGVALGKLGPEAKHAVPKLFQLLSSDEDRDFASSSLKEINAAPVEAVGLLIEKLDSEDRRMSFYAVSLLGKIGPPAAEALPKLEAMLAKPSSDPGRSDFRRKFLTEAIAAIKGEAQPDK